MANPSSMYLFWLFGAVVGLKGAYIFSILSAGEYLDPHWLAPKCYDGTEVLASQEMELQILLV